MCRRWDSNPHEALLHEILNFATPAGHAHQSAVCQSVWPMGNIGDPWGYAEPSVKRIHRKIFKLNDKITALDRERRQVASELDYHRSINEDAQRDAVAGNYIDREEAGLTAADVRRFEKALAEIDERLEKLTSKRDYLLATLPD